MARQHISYRPADRPLCEALVYGRWVPAEVRAWMQADDGSWSADVGYNTAGREPAWDVPCGAASRGDKSRA